MLNGEDGRLGGEGGGEGEVERLRPRVGPDRRCMKATRSGGQTLRDSWPRLARTATLGTSRPLTLLTATPSTSTIVLGSRLTTPWTLFAQKQRVHDG